MTDRPSGETRAPARRGTPHPVRAEKESGEQSGEKRLDSLRFSAIQQHQKNNTAKAAALYAKYLNQCPNDATIWSNLGVLMRQTGHREQALRFQQRAYRLGPDLRIVRNNLANSLGDFGRHEEAADLFRGLLDEKPQDSEAVWNLGRNLRALGAYDDAIELLEAGQRVHSAKAQIRLQLALTQLAAGRYADGFRNYEARFETGDVTPPKIDLPRWQGEPLEGKSLLVVREQGLGDSLLCARFLPLLKAQGATVDFVCRRPVRRLFAGSRLADSTSSEMPDTARFDYWASMFDLPLHHFAGGGTIPAPVRFSIPEESLERADALVRPHSARVRVGVVWSGSVSYKANRIRAFSHEACLPLAEVEGVQLFSLYKGPLLEAYRADASNAVMIDAASTDADLADCAATITRLDLVITADTAVAHLAASMGVEVWCLLHWDPFWLYGHSADRTPWYPTMRLYRQRRPMDWDEVFARVRQDLDARVRSRSQ